MATAECVDCGRDFTADDAKMTCSDCSAPACNHCGADFDRDGDPTCTCIPEEG